MWPASLFCSPTEQTAAVMGKCGQSRLSINSGNHGMRRVARPLCPALRSQLHIQLEKTAPFTPVTQLRPAHYGQDMSNGRGESTVCPFPATCLQAVGENQVAFRGDSLEILSQWESPA